MDIQALCDAVNQLIVSEGIEIENGRTSSLVTPRNIRYYSTIGIMPAPKRLDSKSTYDGTHVNAVMTIKRSQMAGLSLKEIKAQQQLLTAPPILSEVALNKTLAFSSFNAQLHQSPIGTLASRFVRHDIAPNLGWCVRVGECQLSGFGNRPTDEQLNAVDAILLGAAFGEESDKENGD